MKFGQYRFMPSLWPSLFFLVLLPFFLSLGLWQLNRAEEKLQILEALEEKKTAMPKSIGLINVETDENSRIHLSGEVLSKQQFLLDNKVHNGVAGYELIIPVRLSLDGRIVLVSRGWVAQGVSRSDLPDVALQAFSLNRASGLFTKPSKGFTIGAAFVAESDSWPKVIQYLDYNAIAEVLEAVVIEGVVQLDKAVGKEHPKLWTPVAFGPNKHYGYAAQWFAIALVLSLLYIILNTQKEESQ